MKKSIYNLFLYMVMVHLCSSPVWAPPKQAGDQKTDEIGNHITRRQVSAPAAGYDTVEFATPAAASVAAARPSHRFGTENVCYQCLYFFASFLPSLSWGLPKQVSSQKDGEMGDAVVLRQVSAPAVGGNAVRSVVFSPAAASVAMASPGSMAKAGYQCIYDNRRGPVPAADTPYQARPTSLSQRFLDRYARDHPGALPYQFPTEGNRLAVLGDYRVDEEMLLGRGDEGCVFLGKHLPTGIFVGAKSISTKKGEVLSYHGFRALQILNQLYSAWGEDFNYTDKIVHTHAYLIIPFVDGEIISFFQDRNPWIETTLIDNRLEFSDLFAGLRLIRSLVRQLNYIALRGVYHDSTSGNTMVTHDYKDVVLLDFGSAYDGVGSFSPSDPAHFDVLPYAFTCHYFLGTRPFLERIAGVERIGPGKYSRTQAPSPEMFPEIATFLSSIPNDRLIRGYLNLPSEFHLNTFNDAYQALETSLASRFLVPYLPDEPEAVNTVKKKKGFEVRALVMDYLY